MTNEVPSTPEPEEFEFQHWAEQFIRDNPPPPLNDKQRDVLSRLGEYLLSDHRSSSQPGDDEAR